jgi:hypothetical protein
VHGQQQTAGSFSTDDVTSAQTFAKKKPSDSVIFVPKAPERYINETGENQDDMSITN